MKKCKYCMSEINEKAIVCPVCKKNQNQRKNINKIITIIAFSIIIIIIFLFIKERNNVIDTTDKIRNNSFEVTKDY